MARTHGHGNPDWTRDETILALALYFECADALPSPRDARVRKLSELLRSLPYHAESSKKESFRNPDGVAFKLQNLHNVATGKGLGNVSAMDRKIWTEFGSRPHEARSLAELIKAGIDYTTALAERADPDDDDVFLEGRLQYRRKWCDKLGLGFNLANHSQLSQPKHKPAAPRKAA